MRKEFFKLLAGKMEKDKRIWVLTGDLGYGLLDEIRDKFPDRFVNCGASEQAMMGIACGLAMEGKIPFVYSITPFALYRPFETIRNYVNYEKTPVKIVGSGRGKDYHNEGYSHHSFEDEAIFKHVFKNIQAAYPEEEKDLADILHTMLAHAKPYFLVLRK